MSAKCDANALRCFGLGLLAYATASALAAGVAKPDFGPNVLIFNPSMPAAVIHRQIDTVYATQQHNEFGPQRNVLMFRIHSANPILPFVSVLW